jgi:hypothetical protein
MQGGLKLLPKVLRTHHGATAPILAAAAKVLGKCMAASPASQLSLAKEKVGVGQMVWG